MRAVELLWDQDTAGRLTGIQEEEFERRFGYDGLGRVTQDQVSREGVVSLSVGYGYDEATGELSSITYPSGTVLRGSYDAAGSDQRASFWRARVGHSYPLSALWAGYGHAARRGTWTISIIK